MMLWDQAVEVLRESIFAYAQLCNGNLGAGILAVTFLARLALLPWGFGWRARRPLSSEHWQGCSHLSTHFEGPTRKIRSVWPRKQVACWLAKVCLRSRWEVALVPSLRFPSSWRFTRVCARPWQWAADSCGSATSRNRTGSWQLPPRYSRS